MTSNVLERYRKRRQREVTINGDTFTIRGLTKPERRRVEVLKDPDLQDALSAAFCMLNDDGSFIFTPRENETDEDFARRVSVEIEDIPPETRFDLALAVVRLAKPPALENLVKN